MARARRKRPVKKSKSRTGLSKKKPARSKRKTIAKKDDSIWMKLIYILLLGLVFRVAFLDEASLRHDEGVTRQYSLMGNVDWMQFDMIATSVHPPGYYLALFGWAELFGDSAWSIRFLSVLFGLGTIYLVYLIGKELYNPKTGLLASVLMAVSQFQIEFAHIARNYTMIIFLTAVTYYALARWLKGKSWWMLGLYVIGTVASILTHWFMGLVLVAQGIFFLVRWKSTLKVWWKYAIACVLILLLIAPSIPMLFDRLDASSHFRSNLADYSGSDFSLTALDESNFFLRLGMMLFHIMVGKIYSNFGNLWFVLFFLVGVVSCGTLGIMALKKWKDGDKYWLLLTGIAVPVIVLSIMWITGAVVQLMYTRYLAMISVPLMLFLATALGPGRGGSRAKWSYPTLAFVGLIVVSIVSNVVYFYENPSIEDWRPMIDRIHSDIAEGEIVVVGPGSEARLADYYLRDDIDDYSILPNSRVADNPNLLGLWGNRGIHDINEVRVDDKSKACEVVDWYGPKEGMWFIQVKDPVFDPNGYLHECLEERFINVDVWHYPSFNIWGQELFRLTLRHYY